MVSCAFGSFGFVEFCSSVEAELSSCGQSQSKTEQVSKQFLFKIVAIVVFLIFIFFEVLTFQLQSANNVDLQLENKETA